MVVPPNHPIFIGFSIINHPFWGVSLFLETPNIVGKIRQCSQWKTMVLTSKKLTKTNMKTPQNWWFVDVSRFNKNIKKVFSGFMLVFGGGNKAVSFHAWESKKKLGGGFKHFLFSPPDPWFISMSQFDDCAYFSNGLKLDHQLKKGDHTWQPDSYLPGNPSK